MNINALIHNMIGQLPEAEGPIPVTKDSYPFCAMDHSRIPLNVQEYGYTEEEFFLSGMANVYDADENDQLVLKKANNPYKNRILVRRPANKKDFSGRVYIDILNATQCYDIEDLWHRNYLWCMENGHAYVGITSKPVCVQSLKNFDYDRYKDLNWADGITIPAPTLSSAVTIPGTEEGLVWDIISQTAALLRYGKENNCLGGYQPEYIYLAGQSQSGAYINTYISYFDQFLIGPDDKHLFDGYMNIVGALVQRRLCQDSIMMDLKLDKRNMHPSSTPYICISSEGDFGLFNLFLADCNLLDIKIENVNEPDNKCRYYEIAATPHTDIICPVLSDLNDIEKTGRKLPNLNKELLCSINDIPTEFYICGLLEKLHLWASKGEAPEIVELFRRKGKKFERDSYGNILGGLRSPFLDVPIASYVANNDNDPEGICGEMTYFTKNKFEEVYKTKENYLMQFKKATMQQVEDGWISETDGNKMIAWSQQAVLKLR